MKHRKPRRPDWRKRPPKRMIKPWSQVEIVFGMTDGLTSALMDGVHLKRLRIEVSILDGDTRYFAVDVNGNVYARNEKFFQRDRATFPFTLRMTAIDGSNEHSCLSPMGYTSEPMAGITLLPTLTQLCGSNAWLKNTGD